MTEEIVEALRQAYDSAAAGRDSQGRSGWKEDERRRFWELLRRENKRRLLEVGAGPGFDSKFFQEKGLQVVATDLSPQMVGLCLEKGLDAKVMDFRYLDFDADQFDAVYALNCLLHVPKLQLIETLEGIKRVLKPSGLFYLAVYGGQESEGIWEDDHHQPRRFFSFYLDSQIVEITGRLFKIEDFKVITPQGISEELHVQRLILRKEQIGAHNEQAISYV